MLNYFPLNNHPIKLFAEIGKAIEDLYPIGITVNDPNYNEYPGIKKITAVIERNMTDNKRFNEPWKVFLKKLKSTSKKRIHNSGYAHELAFSGYLILERYQDEAFSRTKKIVFSVSLIAPYFTVFGVDETGIKDIWHDRPVEYPAINVITESPYKEFEEKFKFLRAEIEEQFPIYKFIPVKACLYYVEGLQTASGHLGARTVHNALFNDFFDNYDVRHFRGDSYYGTGISNYKVELKPPPPLPAKN